MKKVLALAGLLAVGCVRHNLTVTPHAAQGYSYFEYPDGAQVVVLRSERDYSRMLAERCKTPCAVERVGEMFVLERLK